MNTSGQKVLVTGADGFIGSHLTELLIEKGANVRALCLYNSFGTKGWLENSPCVNQVEVVLGDVRDPYFCIGLLKEIDVVFHLAALIAIPYSYTAPEGYAETNVKGTLNICRAALEAGVGKLVHTSTSEVYGSALYVPIDERHPLQPQSPYSASKIGADAMARSFYYAFNLPIAVARPFNTYGPRQSARAVIPTIIVQLANGMREVNLGDLTPTRDFTYVRDTCEALVRIAESEKTVGEEINIGTNREISIGELFESIQTLMGSEATVTQEQRRLRPERSEVKRLKCDNTKLRALTGFSPPTDLEQGLRMTIEWFQNPQNLCKYKAAGYVI